MVGVIKTTNYENINIFTLLFKKIYLIWKNLPKRRIVNRIAKILIYLSVFGRESIKSINYKKSNR